MNDMRLRLRLLHLSDLHARAGDEAEPWRQRRVLGPAWQANLDALLEDGPFDLVCFTGDATDQGRAEEFNEAGDFLLALMDRLRLDRDRLFVVPGNHDVDRRVYPAAWSGLRDAAWQVDDLDLARWLAGGPAPRGIEPAWRKRVMERQAAYRAWVRDGLGRGELDPAAGTMGYRVRLELRGVPVHVIGLNTAWLSGDDHDAARLWVTDAQAGRLATDAGGEPLDGLRLVLQHHPLEELADGARIRAFLADHADLVLRGHLHETELATWADPGHSLRQLAAGRLYGGHRGDNWPNACQVVTLDLGADGRPRQVEVRLRGFSPKGGHWFDDDGLYRESRGGRMHWIVPPRRAVGAAASSRRSLALRRNLPLVPLGENLFEPWKPVLPPSFQGRKSEILRLNAALKSGGGMSIVGDPRIGKSSLLLAWKERLEGSGRKVCYLDGQGPEGETEATFVAKAIGRYAADADADDAADAAADALAAWVDDESEGLAPVLLVDELDGLPARFDPRFFERLRNLMGRVVLVVASRLEVNTLYRQLGRTSPFANRLRVLRLGLLTEAAAEAVIDSGELDPGAAALMRRWAGRHPLYLQLLGHALVEARQFSESSSDALDRFRDDAEWRLDELWRRLGKRDRAALRSVDRDEPIKRRSLIRRGLVDHRGRPFGEVLTAWLQERE